MRYFIILFSFVFLLSASATIDKNKAILEVMQLGIILDTEDGLKRALALRDYIDMESKDMADSTEILAWKGVAEALVASFAGFPTKISAAKRARKYLDKAVSMQPLVLDGIAIVTLAILYHRAPAYISFGDNNKAELLFKQAIQISSNTQNNWRYAEFLHNTDRGVEALQYVNKALELANKNDPLDLVRMGRAEALRDKIVKSINAKATV